MSRVSPPPESPKVSPSQSSSPLVADSLVRVPTSGQDSRCLLRAMAISLLAQAQFGGSVARDYLSSPRRHSDLFEAIARVRPELAEAHLGSQQVTLVRLANSGLSLEQQELILTSALHQILVSLIVSDAFKDVSQREWSDGLEEVLIADFQHWQNKQHDKMTDCFYGMSFIENAYHQINQDEEIDDKSAELRAWWKRAGYAAYAEETRTKNGYLGGTAIGILCNHLRFNFDRPDVANNTLLINEVNTSSPVTVTAYYNGRNHWEAVLPQSIAHKFLQRDHGSRQVESVGPLSPKPLSQEDYASRYGYEGDADFESLLEQGAGEFPNDPEAAAFFAVGGALLDLDSQQAKDFAEVAQKAKKKGRSEAEAIGLAIAQYQFSDLQKKINTEEKESEGNQKGLQEIDKKLENKGQPLPEDKRKGLTSTQEKLQARQKEIHGGKNQSGKEIVGSLPDKKRKLRGFQERFAVLFARKFEQVKTIKNVTPKNLGEICDTILDKKKGEAFAAVKIQHAWRKGKEAWKQKETPKMEQIIKTIESDPNSVKVKMEGTKSGTVTFTIKDPNNASAPAEQVIIRFTHIPGSNDPKQPKSDSLDLKAEPSKHLNICFRKFAELTFQRLKEANGGVPITEITLSGIQPSDPKSKRDCRQAFIDAGFTTEVHIKVESARLFKSPSSCGEEAGFQVVDTSPKPVLPSVT